MINLAVIELKDIIKYLFKITVVIVAIVGLTKYFSSFKTKLNIEKNSFLSCLDIVIPGMENINKTEDIENQKASIEPLKLALDTELGVISSIKKNENIDSVFSETNTEDIKDDDSNDEKIVEAETGLSTEVIDSNVPEKYSTEYNGVKIRNETDNIELTDDMLVPDIELNSENILIYHTHTCESYTKTENFDYEETGNFRTTDINYSVVRVGTELTKYMEYYGYNVIHDTTLYDYPSYSNSYDRSLENVDKILKENEDKDIEILFDIHRDAIGDSTYAPTVKIGDEEAAQLMFVIGTNGGGSEHDNWNDNLKFAIKIQEKANEMYPGLFKPIILRDSRYNQQLGRGSSIIEVGATGNTMEQCLNSMKYLSKVLNEVLK